MNNKSIGGYDVVLFLNLKYSYYINLNEYLIFLFFIFYND